MAGISDQPLNFPRYEVYAVVAGWIFRVDTNAMFKVTLEFPIVREQPEVEGPGPENGRDTKDVTLENKQWL